MKRFALVGSLVLTTSVVLAPIAMAQEDPTCAEAITALQRADTDHRAAVEADEKADEAEKADDELTRAEERLADAQSAAQAKGVAREHQTEQSADRLRGERDELREVEDRSVAQDQRLAEIDERLPLIDAVLDARDEFDLAREAAEETDERALRDEAEKTDADELERALEDARDDFNGVCINGEDDPTTTPAPTTSPAPAPEPAKDITSQVGTVPSGGVDTGGGPA
jgi:hypothetical protein